MQTKRIKLLILGLLIFGCNNNDETLDPAPPSLSITPIAINEISSFIAFGETLSQNQLNPTIEYITNHANILVQSASGGYVEAIQMNSNIDDFEIWVKPSNNSQWLIIYDHILNIKVSVGDKINAGDVLGSIGIGNRTELQINQINHNQEIAYCPLNFGTNNFVQQHTNFSKNWCIAKTVTP
ncbi:M23 family metallopeptidase [Flavivirga algicola]|uniref:M23 family metallopeptidase n=1 Tax=Flavivirga algicola TaxID=2729136 RepID=A0ABX1S267_9FLAO|nr:hypothetical protein [Flavivirga algicola]NMH89143.1 M23 family metallopeptidase [Flavivirga algicola]